MFDVAERVKVAVSQVKRTVANVIQVVPSGVRTPAELIPPFWSGNVPEDSPQAVGVVERQTRAT